MLMKCCWLVSNGWGGMVVYVYVQLQWAGQDGVSQVSCGLLMVM